MAILQVVVVTTLLLVLPLCTAANDWDFTSASSKKEVVDRTKGSAQFALFSTSPATPPPMVMTMAGVRGTLSNLTNNVSKLAEVVAKVHKHPCVLSAYQPMRFRTFMSSYCIVLLLLHYS